MVAMKRKAVYRELRNTMSSPIADVWEDHDSAVDRLRHVLDARDAATWNFDFRTSTPLPGRYDWQRPSGHAVKLTPIERAADRDRFSVRRGRWPSSSRRSSARRRLVFDEQDLAAADGVATTFLLRRLISPQRYPETPEQCSPEELRSTSSMSPAVVAFDNEQRHQKTAVSSDSTNFRVQPASSTGRRTSPMMTKRTQTPVENAPLRIPEITEYFVSKKRRETRDASLIIPRKHQHDSPHNTPTENDDQTR